MSKLLASGSVTLPFLMHDHQDVPNTPHFREPILGSVTFPLADPSYTRSDDTNTLRPNLDVLSTATSDTELGEHCSYRHEKQNDITDTLSPKFGNITSPSLKRKFEDIEPTPG